MTEDELVTLAIAPEARKRYRELLVVPKQRQRLLDSLNHRPPLDQRYTTWYGSFQKALDTVQVDIGCSVRILSAAQSIDGKTMPMGEALQLMFRSGSGTIFGLDSSTALYYGEGGERGAVVRKQT